MVTDKVVTPVFFSTDTAIRPLNAPAIAASPLVSLKGSVLAVSPLSSSLSLNKDTTQPNALKGAEVIAPHQGPR